MNEPWLKTSLQFLRRKIGRIVRRNAGKGPMYAASLRVGDCVRVNSDVRDPDFGMDIGGWQGRIREPEEEGIVLVAWDSITLKNMGVALIVRCERKNLDWEVMALSMSELSKAPCRDTRRAVSATVASIRAKLLKDPRLKDIFGP
jgi:hypothetical protein